MKCILQPSLMHVSCRRKSCEIKDVRPHKILVHTGFRFPESINVSFYQNVLDLGSGSGALSIAAALCGAGSVVANDIDPVANEALKMNILLNKGGVGQ